jgi:uncharacterized protein YyaL (SSP411 family)
MFFVVPLLLSSGALGFSLASEPRPILHVTIVAKKKDPQGQALFDSAKKYLSHPEMLEWLDPDEASLSKRKIKYPSLKTAAAFICTGNQCSRPIFQAEKLVERIEMMNQAKN